jgi:hypothetical protein
MKIARIFSVLFCLGALVLFAGCGDKEEAPAAPAKAPAARDAGDE